MRINESRLWGGAVAALLVLSQPALAFCDPPIAPPLTSEALAREYRDEFKEDFETYFRAGQAYLLCIDQERSDVMRELSETAIRYERFLTDSEHWQ